MQEAGSAPPYGVTVNNVQAMLPLAMCLHAICHGAEVITGKALTSDFISTSASKVKDTDGVLHV